MQSVATVLHPDEPPLPKDDQLFADALPQGSDLSGYMKPRGMIDMIQHAARSPRYYPTWRLELLASDANFKNLHDLEDTLRHWVRLREEAYTATRRPSFEAITTQGQ